MSDAAKTNVLELLLRPEAQSVSNKPQEASFEVERLSKVVGAPVIFRLRALPYGQVQEISQRSEDSEVHILLAGCVEPNLKDPSLREKYGGETPADLIKRLLIPGEISDLSREVEKLCGYRMRTIKEIKNG